MISARLLPCRQRLPYVRNLMRELVAREIKLRYQGSVLGIVWSLLNPIIHLLIFYFLFRLVLDLKIARYTSFALSGILAWNWFQASLSQAAVVVTNNRELIRWPGFPTAILPAITVATNLIDFLLALPVLIFLLWCDNVQLQLVVLLLPIVVAIQFFLTLSLAFLVAASNVIFRDTQHLVGVALRLLFFLSPVVYDSNIVPALYQPLYRLNPMVHLLDAYRAVLIGGILPEGAPLLVLGGVTAGLVFGGLKIFERTRYRFVEEV